MRMTTSTRAMHVSAASILPLALVWLGAFYATFFNECVGSYALGQSPKLRMEDVSAECGIEFQHFSGRTGKHFIIETVTSGLATFDYDGDGWLDVYLLNGAPLRGEGFQGPPPTNRLFRNVGGFRFEDVTERSLAGDTGFALGVAAGDYDNDGDEDLLISNFGPSVLLENLGDGTFRRLELAHPEKPRVGAGVAMLDIEGDGDLDFYVSNYVDFSFDRDVSREIFGVPAAPGPKDYQPDTDSLYRNNGDGTFSDVSVSSGIAAVAGPGMGLVAFDFDGDQDTDVFVCNDSAANFLFENQGDGTFLESALFAGVACDVTGSRQASMGVDVGDIDHDGHLDMVTTNFMDELPTLYKNSGLGYFDDIGAAAGLGVADRSVTWGVCLKDFNNDAWADLFIAAGHLIDSVSQMNDAEKFEAPNLLLTNQRGQRFVNQVDAPEASVGRPKVSRGAVADDLDGDGRVDLVVLDLNDKPQVLRNTTTDVGHCLRLRLVGVNSNRSAAGAKVSVVSEGNDRQVDELLIGRGYQSHYGSVLHFGLKQATSCSVEVVWPSGRRQQWNNLGSDQEWTLIESISQADSARIIEQ